MRHKISLIFIVLLSFSSLLYSQSWSQYPGGICPYDENTHFRVQRWLMKAYKNAVQAIINGINGKRLPQCKIDEIKRNLPKVKLEYACKGCDACGKGSTQEMSLKIMRKFNIDKLNSRNRRAK